MYQLEMYQMEMFQMSAVKNSTKNVFNREFEIKEKVKKSNP